MTDRDRKVEQVLTDALRARTDGVEPTSDSFVRLEQRVVSAPSATRRAGSPRYLAAAAALMVMVGAAAALTVRQRSGTVEVFGTGPSTTAPTVPTEVRVTTTSTTMAPDRTTVTTTPPRSYVSSPVAGPRAETPAAAAEAFLDLLGVNHAGLEVDGLTVRARLADAGGRASGTVTQLELIEAEVRKGTLGYSVIEAYSEGVDITSPARGSEYTRSPLVVVAELYPGFSEARVELVSSVGGVALVSSESRRLEGVQNETITVELEVSGAERGWVVLWAEPVGEEGGADAGDRGASFSAIPISFVIDAREGEPLEPLTAPRPELTDRQITDLATSFHRAGVERDLAALVALPWAEAVEIGWIQAPADFERAEVTSEQFWSTSHTWSMPAEVGDPSQTMSALSLLDLGGLEAGESAYEVDAEPVSPYALDQQAFAPRRDGETRSVTIFDPTPDTPWHHTTLVLSPGESGPEIAAVLLTVWVP